MIIGVAGPIASGKSTLARALADRFSLKLVSFGAYVRQCAEARGLNASDRDVLQDLGQSMVDENAAAFVAGALAPALQPNGRIVLDGVRHGTVWKEVESIASSRRSPAKLVFLDMPEEERYRRLLARGLSQDQASAQDAHASERDVQQWLAEKADLRIDAMQEQPSMLLSISSRFGLE